MTTSPPPTPEKARHSDTITRYECDACTYDTFIPDRHGYHYPRGEYALPGERKAKCPGTVEAVTYHREQHICGPGRCKCYPLGDWDPGQ